MRKQEIQEDKKCSSVRYEVTELGLDSKAA